MQRVSVIIPTYNHARFLSQAIESALGQTQQPAEVIVVDDGSRDQTADVLAAFAGRIRPLRQMNRGVAAARNAGAGLASGEFFAFLDADDIWLPPKLERQIACFLAESDLGLVHCGVEEIDESGAGLKRREDGLEGWVAHELLLFRRAVILGGGSGVMIPRAVFEDAGGFDERLSTSADWDLYYRIASRWRVGFVREVLLQYRLHGSNMHGNVRAMERDMLFALGKAFDNTERKPGVARRRCYGNLHTALAGAFFANGDSRRFLANAVKSLLLTPGNVGRYLGYPLRWRRRKENAKTSAAI